MPVIFMEVSLIISSSYDGGISVLKESNGHLRKPEEIKNRSGFVTAVPLASRGF
jgi:hypothetical protein